MRVIEFSGYHGTLRIPSGWTAFTYAGKTYEVVNGRVRPRPLSPPHPRPGKKAKGT